MPSLVFRQLKQGLLNRAQDITTGTIYVELVTTAPTDPLLTTKSQLTLATGGNYVHKVVLVNADSRTFTLTSTGVFWTFSNPVWTSLTTNGAATIKGMVICKQSGGSPAGTDPIWVYNELNSPYTPNGANFTVQIASNGVLELP